MLIGQYRVPSCKGGGYSLKLLPKQLVSESHMRKYSILELNMGIHSVREKKFAIFKHLMAPGFFFQGISLFKIYPLAITSKLLYDKSTF